MRRGSVLKIAAVGVVGLAAAGVFGYKAVTGKCLLTGTCESTAANQAVVTPVAATGSQDEPCPMGCSESKDASVQTVAHTQESECADKAVTCTEMSAECADKAAECADKATECADKAADCAEDCNAETCDKPDCCKKVAQTDATEKVGG